MSDGFWSLRNAPAWWFSKRAWVGIAIMAVVLLGSRWYHGPSRVPPRQVVFYGAAWCPYSEALREHLAASNIPYDERNVDESFGNLVRYMWAAGKGGRLPVVQVGPTVVSKGYYRGNIDQALKAAGYQPAEGPSGPEGGSERR
jgi:glutaredoxin